MLGEVNECSMSLLSREDQEAHQDQVPFASVQLGRPQTQPDQRHGLQRDRRRADPGGTGIWLCRVTFVTFVQADAVCLSIHIPILHCQLAVCES